MTLDSEIIYISLGQSGVQKAHADWELFSLEHGVDVEGTLMDENPDPTDRIRVFYYESSSNVYVPRSVMVDLEPTVIDEIRSGAYKNFHNSDMLITGFEDAAGNYARGYFSKGRHLVDRCMDAIRKQVCRCDSLQGFLLASGLGGGTGSGFAALLLERLNIEYGKTGKIMINVFPGPSMSTAVVEPYNVALTTRHCIEFTDVNITLDNEAVYKICTERLNFPRPTYNNVNRLMAQVSSAITCSLRFASSLNSDLTQMQTNLVPYPRIHFPIVSYAPISCPKLSTHERLTPRQAVRDLFESSGRLVSCDTTLGKFIACNLQFRGYVSPSEMNSALQQIKSNHHIEFVDWCPTGFKVGISGRPPLCVPSSMIAASEMNCTMLANSTAIGTIWERLKTKFDVLFEKRAFVHWYVSEGMEEGELTEAVSEMQDIIADYNDISRQVEDDEEGEDNYGENDVEKDVENDRENDRENVEPQAAASPGNMGETNDEPVNGQDQDGYSENSPNDTRPSSPEENPESLY